MSSTAPSGLLATATATATTTVEERAQAAAMRSGSGGASTDLHLPAVLVDEDAVQKYALIAVYASQGRDGDDDSGSTRYFVRGSKHAAYHKDAAGPLVEELRQLQVPFEVVGGGRISHRAQGEIKVYGFSYGFPWKNGQSKHHVTAELLRARFPGQPVSYSDDGY